MKKALIAKFQELYGAGEVNTYFAPGRVNLIGEHTDYNGGHVFPCALTLGTYAVARKRNDRVLRFYSMNFEELGILESSLDNLVATKDGTWTEYPLGVIWAFEKKGMPVSQGMDVLIYGNIPNGSGLSSSASLEVLTGTMLKDLYHLPVSMTEIAQIGQYSENNYNGCNCGIMDQFASAMGKKDHAIFLDTNTLQYEYAPVNLSNEKIVITNSKVKHSLVDSAYNDRRNECENALAALKKVIDIQTLGDLTEDKFEEFKSHIKDTTQQKRAKHAVYENQRTIRAVEVLKKGDIITFGKLMNESHISLRDDYEVSCPEVDFLVEQSWKLPGVLGSRITGGGFGGCTVSIVKNEAIDEFVETIKNAYAQKFNLEAEFYIVDLGDGAHVL